MQKFKSKIDGRIWVPVGLLFLTVAVLFFAARLWAGFVLLASAAAFILHLIFTTVYVVTPEGDLLIRCGLLYKRRIKIQSVKKIVRTTNPLSSPALSLKRLELSYNRCDTVMISPEEEGLFLEALKRQNPQLVVQ